MFNIDRIPVIWKKAYFILCLWYAINFTISTIIEYQLETPFTYIFWNSLYLYEALCILIVVIMFYSHFLFRFNIYFQIVGHLLGAMVFFLIMGSLSYYLEDYVEGFIYFDNWVDHLIGLLKWKGLHFHDQYIITAAVYYVIRYFEKVQREEKEKGELRLKNRDMQLSLLKSQINPHFLFNTLNSINTLIGSSKDQARRVITQLSDIFRYALDSRSDQMMKLVHEIDFIDNYIRIQQVRFGDRLRYSKQVDPVSLNVDIPPMILQPLVENAVKYGISPKTEGGTVSLTVKHFNKMLFFEVKDDGMGSNASKLKLEGGNGVGLKNTDRRLRSIFGPDSGLRIRSNQWGYSVSFFIPFKEQVSPVEEHPFNELKTKAL